MPLGAARSFHGLSVAALAAARPIEARWAKSFNVFGGSGAPCGGRAYRGGPRPAHGAYAPTSACAADALLRPTGAALATLGRIGRVAPAPSATLRAKICTAPAGVSRCNRDAAVRWP